RVTLWAVATGGGGVILAGERFCLRVSTRADPVEAKPAETVDVSNPSRRRRLLAVERQGFLQPGQFALLIVRGQEEAGMDSQGVGEKGTGTSTVSGKPVVEQFACLVRSLCSLQQICQVVD